MFWANYSYLVDVYFVLHRSVKTKDTELYAHALFQLTSVFFSDQPPQLCSMDKPAIIGTRIIERNKSIHFHCFEMRFLCEQVREIICGSRC